MESSNYYIDTHSSKKVRHNSSAVIEAISDNTSLIQPTKEKKTWYGRFIQCFSCGRKNKEQTPLLDEERKLDTLEIKTSNRYQNILSTVLKVGTVAAALLTTAGAIWGAYSSYSEEPHLDKIIPWSYGVIAGASQGIAFSILTHTAPNTPVGQTVRKVGNFIKTNALLATFDFTQLYVNCGLPHTGWGCPTDPIPLPVRYGSTIFFNSMASFYTTISLIDSIDTIIDMYHKQKRLESRIDDDTHIDSGINSQTYEYAAEVDAAAHAGSLAVIGDTHHTKKRTTISSEPLQFLESNIDEGEGQNSIKNIAWFALEQFAKIAAAVGIQLIQNYNIVNTPLLNSLKVLLYANAGGSIAAFTVNKALNKIAKTHPQVFKYMKKKIPLAVRIIPTALYKFSENAIVGVTLGIADKVSPNTSIAFAGAFSGISKILRMKKFEKLKENSYTVEPFSRTNKIHLIGTSLIYAANVTWFIIDLTDPSPEGMPSTWDYFNLAALLALGAPGAYIATRKMVERFSPGQNGRFVNTVCMYLSKFPDFLFYPYLIARTNYAMKDENSNALADSNFNKVFNIIAWGSLGIAQGNSQAFLAIPKQKHYVADTMMRASGQNPEVRIARIPAPGILNAINTFLGFGNLRDV